MTATIGCNLSKKSRLGKIALCPILIILVFELMTGSESRYLHADKLVAAASGVNSGDGNRLINSSHQRHPHSQFKRPEKDLYSGAPQTAENEIPRKNTVTVVPSLGAGQDKVSTVPGQKRSHGYGGGGGGGGAYHHYNYGAGSLMYFSNFDTALTTLAFLSFGVFLLNMILSFLDLGTPLGPINDAGVRVRRQFLDIPVMIAQAQQSTDSVALNNATEANDKSRLRRFNGDSDQTGNKSCPFAKMPFLRDLKMHVQNLLENPRSIVSVISSFLSSRLNKALSPPTETSKPSENFQASD